MSLSLARASVNKERGAASIDNWQVSEEVLVSGLVIICVWITPIFPLYLGGHNQFTRTKYTRPNTYISRSIDKQRSSQWLDGHRQWSTPRPAHGLGVVCLHCFNLFCTDVMRTIMPNVWCFGFHQHLHVLGNFCLSDVTIPWIRLEEKQKRVGNILSSVFFGFGLDQITGSYSYNLKIDVYSTGPRGSLLFNSRTCWDSSSCCRCRE